MDTTSKSTTSKSTTQKISIDGRDYIALTAEEQKTFSEKIFTPTDSLKDGDKLTFDNGLSIADALKTSAVINGNTVEWVAIKATRTRNGENKAVMIAVSTLTGSGYEKPNPLFGMQKNVSFNPEVIENIQSLPNDEKLLGIISYLKGKSFTISRDDFYNPTKWENKIDEKGAPVYKENGKNAMQPVTETNISGEKFIPTTRRTVSVLK